MAQQILLIAIAALIGLLFVSSWPQRLLYLRQNLPLQISMKWFLSFPSKSTLTEIQSAEFYNNLGYNYALQGQFVQAIALFTKAIEIVPNYAPAYYNREILYDHLKEYDKAWGDVHKAQKWGIKDDPGLMSALKRDSGR